MKMMPENEEKELFDDWPEKYDRWFETPIGALVKKYEGELIRDFVQPSKGERILDAGCGTGVFTRDFLSSGARVTGLDVSIPMLLRARVKTPGVDWPLVTGDILKLPFAESSFGKVISVTALEFIADGQEAVRELFRVAKPGGLIVVASLNSLSPWAVRRKASRHPLFDQAFFRSPEELLALAPGPGIVRTAVHFQKHDDPRIAVPMEQAGKEEKRNTGAFLVARWIKPL
jgi:ubiquinone/menaquinone biosynthesis C-methylase UbiE